MPVPLTLAAWGSFVGRKSPPRRGGLKPRSTFRDFGAPSSASGRVLAQIAS